MLSGMSLQTLITNHSSLLINHSSLIIIVVGKGQHTAKETGQQGEARALVYLQEKGYTLVQQNFRYRRAEIDLIVQKDRLLVFVEVKARQNADFGFPETFVSAQQTSLIVEAADHYVREQNWPGLIRFDIVAITLEPDVAIEHFEDAFY